MILRLWKATTTTEKEPDYLETVKRSVLPHLGEVPGYRGSIFVKRDGQGELEYMVLSFWDSIEHIKELTGVDPSKAFVPPEIRATLDGVGETAEHFELVLAHEIESFAE